MKSDPRVALQASRLKGKMHSGTPGCKPITTGRPATDAKVRDNPLVRDRAASEDNAPARQCSSVLEHSRKTRRPQLAAAIKVAGLQWCADQRARRSFGPTTVDADPIPKFASWGGKRTDRSDEPQTSCRIFGRESHWLQRDLTPTQATVQTDHLSFDICHPSRSVRIVRAATNARSSPALKTKR